MKKILKLSSVLVIAMIVMMLFSNIVMAFDWTSSVNTFSTLTDKSSASGSVQNVVGAIIAVTRVIAVGVAIIMLVVLAMKYMMAAPGDRADIKKHAVVYVVGAVILFATSGILGIIANFASAIS